MKPRYLYHGSSCKITSEKLSPRKARDKSKKGNSLYAVYATNRKDIALGMALTGGKYTTSMGNYHEKPFCVIFIRGQPKMKYCYVYKVSAKGFEERPKGSYQWVSFSPTQIISVEKLRVEDLKRYWRKATKKDKEYWKRKYN